MKLYTFNGKLMLEFEKDDFTKEELTAICDWRDSEPFVDVPSVNALDEPATGGGGTGNDA